MTQESDTEEGDTTRGIVYMVIGDDFVQEAAVSACSAKAQMPDIDITIAVDSYDYDLTAFDDVVLLDDNRVEVIDGRTWMIDSTIPPELSPYDKTLYLDSDTYLTAPVYELFDMLDRYDLAIARTPDLPRDHIEDLPPHWCHLNCGVIAYRSNDVVHALLDRWTDIYWDMLDRQDEPMDQPAFARALYESDDVRWFTLPREYNVRVPRRGKLASKAKIIHGRHPLGLERVAKELNRTERIRVFRERSKFFPPAFIVKDRGSFRYHTEVTLTRLGPTMLPKVALAYTSDRLLGTNLMEDWLDKPSVG